MWHCTVLHGTVPVCQPLPTATSHYHCDLITLATFQNKRLSEITEKQSGWTREELLLSWGRRLLSVMQATARILLLPVLCPGFCVCLAMQTDPPWLLSAVQNWAHTRGPATGTLAGRLLRRAPGSPVLRGCPCWPLRAGSSSARPRSAAAGPDGRGGAARGIVGQRKGGWGSCPGAVHAGTGAGGARRPSAGQALARCFGASTAAGGLGPVEAPARRGWRTRRPPPWGSGSCCCWRQGRAKARRRGRSQGLRFPPGPGGAARCGP